MSQVNQKYLILCYGNNPATPGRFLRDGLMEIKQPLLVFHELLDLSRLDLKKCLGIIFVDCPSRPPVKVLHLNLAKYIPKVFWTYHGIHVLRQNISFVRGYQVDQVLMASCLHLKKSFPVPVSFFPLAAPLVFNGKTPLNSRSVDICFVGNTKGDLYAQRRQSLKKIKKAFINKNVLVTKGIYLEKLAQVYNNSKIIINDSINQTMTLRIFEAIASKALLISDSVPEQDWLFKPNLHYVLYSNEKEKLAKLKYYLHSLSEAQIIANQGYEWLMTNHTFINRAQQLVQIFKQFHRG